MTKAIFLAIPVFFSCVLTAAAQTESPQEQAKAYLDQADLIYKQQKEAIEVAKELYVKAASIDPDNIRANWMAGKLYTETINKDRATDYFLKVQALDPNYRFDIQYHIGRGYHYGLDFEKALEYYEAYKKKLITKKSYRGKDRTVASRVTRRIFECKNGLAIISQPTRYSIVPLGENINSPYPDYAPVVSKDGNTMIFTSRRPDGNISEDVDRDNFYFEDIYISRRQGGEWSKAVNIGEPINTRYHEATVALSADGNRLYLYKDEGMGDIYYADFEGGSWSKPKYFTNKVNSSTYTESSLTETNDPGVVFYTSDRPGGYGGMDIYMCTQNSKGDWYKSKSLGPVINTKFDETSPYLAEDGKTLYFSSSGHKGYGGFDIFMSVYDSTDGQWSEPENLGYPVNTPDNEIYFRALKGGRTGYFASVREGGIGFTDIFMIKYHGGAGAPTTGELIAVAKGEKANTHNGQAPEGGAVNGNFEAQEVELMAVSHKIFFNASQSAIQEKHQDELDRIIKLIKKYEVLNIDIAGYASSDGNTRYNLELSHRRAMIVLNYFVENGVPEERIVARGFGSISGAEGLSDEARRAEVRIIGEK